MHFQRFVAWENLPSLTSKSDGFESSSSSKSGSVNEFASEGHAAPKITTTKKETMPVEIPIPVRRVLDKIDVEQLERAKKEISKKLFRILENVNRAYERYKKDDGIDPKLEKEYNTILTWEEKSRRSHFLDDIDDVLNVNMDKLLELRLVLDSLKECNGMLKKVELQEKLIPSEEILEKMETDLLKFIERIEGNVQRLIKLFQPLFAEKMRARRKSGQKYTLLFKAWRDKVADTPQEGEPLTPEQMLDDESLAFTRCHDVNNMIHELGESSFFNKAEIVALKYTATMVGNLIKAFSLLVKQCRNLKLKCDSLTIVEGRKQDPQVLVLQRELRMALERKTALEKQVQSAEERCMALLVTNEMIQKELQDANEKASLADNIPLSRVTPGKPQSKTPVVEKDVKSKQAEKPKLPTEPKKKLTRKGEGEILDEKWESQGEGSEASLLTIYGREPTPTGSIQDIKIKQKKAVSDKGKTKPPPKTTDEKGPPMGGTVIERSPEVLDQMLTSHKTLDTESDRVVPKSSYEKPMEKSPSTMEPSSLTEPTAEDISGQSLQKDKKGARRRLSMKSTADKVVVTMKTKKMVKFPLTKDTLTQDMPSQDTYTTVQEIPEGELTQRPIMTSETKKEPETLDKTLTQTAAAEQTEEAPKQLADKSKDIREKKETKRWSKLLQLPKQAEKSEGVRPGVAVKLQEIARDIPTSASPTQEIPTLDTSIQDTRTQDIPTLDTPTQDTRTQDIPTLDTPTQDTRIQDIPTLDTPTQDTRIQDIPTLDTPTQDTPTQVILTLDTPTQEITRGELTQRPATTSETKEEPVSQDKDLTQKAAAKQTEEAPKQLADKSKDIREKKETKRWSKLLQLPKQAEKSEGVRPGVAVKLQETARDIPTPSIPTPSIPTPDTPTQDIPGGELTQKPTTTSETKGELESQDKDLIQTAIAEQIEEAPKQLAEKSKDIREKKETKRWGKALQLPKKAEKLEGARHSVDMKLQEIARDIPTPSIPTPDTPTQDIPGGELTERRMTSSETKEESESQGKNLTQTAIIEQAEEAPKQLAEKSKDIREKKETKRWGKALQVPKQAEKLEGARHSVDMKLQETARDIPTPSIPTPDTPTQDIPGGELTQKPTTTSETKGELESQDKDLIQTAIAEQIEEAPKQLAEKSKDIREKKETKRWGKALQLPKKAEKLEGIRHGVDAKLQETARDIPTPSIPTPSIPTPDTPTQDIPGGELTQKPTTSETKEEPESQDKDLIQTAIAEQIEEAPKQLAEKSKDIREKKETKRWTKALQLPKQAEKTEGVIHGLNIKLQEIAREKDGMIDIETIKHIFEELEPSYKDTAAGPVAGGRHADKPAKISTVKKSTLLPDTAEQAYTTKEKRRVSRVEETALREFQEATLACLEDKLEKLKKGPPGSGKVSVQFQPTDQQTQQLFKAIQDKVEECFLIKQKSLIHLEEDKQFSQSMEKLEDKSGEEITKIPSSTRVTPTQDISTQDTSPQDIPTQILPPPPQDIPTQVLPPPPQDIPTQVLPPPPQDIPTQVLPPPQQDKPTQILPPPPQDIPTQVLPPPQQDKPPLAPLPQKIPTLATPPKDISTLIPSPSPQDIPPLVIPLQDIPPLVPSPFPQDIPPLVPPPQEMPTLFPPPQDIPTLILSSPLQDIPTLVRPPPPQDIPLLVPPPTLFPPPQEIPPLFPPPLEIPPQVLPPLETPSLILPPLEIPPLVLPPLEIPPQILPPLGIPPLVLPPLEIPTMVPSPLVIPTMVPPPLEIPSLIPPPLEIPSLVPPPLERSILALPPQDTPPLVPRPLGIPPQIIPTLVPPPPPQDILPLVPPPQEIPTLVSLPQDISPLVLPPPPQEIPSLVPPPQIIPPMVLPPPPQEIPTLIPSPQVIPTLVPPPQEISSLVPPPLERSTLTLPPPLQEIPTLIPSPQVIPTLVPPPQKIPSLVPPPLETSTLTLPPPLQEIPTLIPSPQVIPTLVPPPQKIPSLVPPPLERSTLALPPPPQEIPTLIPSPQVIPTLVPPPQEISSLVPPPLERSTLTLPPPLQEIPTLIPSPQVIPTLVPPPQEISSLVPPPLERSTLTLPPPLQEIPTLIPPPQVIPTLVPPPQKIPSLVPPPLERSTLTLPPPLQEIPTLIPSPQVIPTLVPPPQEISSLVPPPLERSTLTLPPPLQEIPTLIPSPQVIPTLVPPPQEISSLVPPPLERSTLTLPPPLQEIPTLIPSPQVIPTLVPPPQEISSLVPPPLERSTLTLPPPLQEIPTLIPSPQVIPTLVPPPQEISSLVPPPLERSTLTLPPPLQEIPTLIPSPQVIPTLVPPPQEISSLVPPPLERSTLTLPPPLQEIPTLIPSPQVIPTLVPPPQKISSLVPPPLERSTLTLPPPLQEIPTLIPPPQVIPTLVPPPQKISSLVPPPLERSTLTLPPPLQEIPTLIPPPQVIPTLVPPPQKISSLVPPPLERSTLTLPPPLQEIPTLIPPPQDKELFFPPDVRLPKRQEKKEDLAKALPLTKEEQSLKRVPDEGDEQVKELKQEDEEQDKNKIIIPISEERPKTVDKGKELSPKLSHLEPKSLQELNIKRELWYQQLQKELLTEKERMQEEQLRIQGECQQIEKAKENLVQWQGLFQKQQEEWKQKQEQHKEQEHRWQMQLEHWRRLQQQNDHYQQYWAEQREKQKEQQCRLQEEVRQLQQQYKQHVILQGEQAKEQWFWNQLKEEHRKQQEIWKEEDKEYEIKRRQWQQQQAKHEGQMETLRQAHLQQEEQYKQWQKEQQKKQQELEHTWEKRWQQQLQSWQQETQKQQDQESRDQEQKSKVLEKQRLIPKEHKPLSPKLKVVESSVLDIFVKPCKMPPVTKEKIISTTPRTTPSSSIALKEDYSELETTWFPKMFTKIEELPTYGITEKRYWINVEAQRKNLKLLREASQRAGISPDLYNDTKETIKQALHSNVERLALLFRKYKSLYNLHEVRHSLILQLDAAREANDGAKMQNLYKMVDKVDAHQKKLLDNWKVKQNVVEKQRQHCLTKMIYLFAQLHSSAQLHLSNPCLLIVKGEDITKKETFHMPHIRPDFLKTKVYKSPLIRVKKSQDFTVTAMVRRKPSSEQIESLWKTDITELSFPLGPKAPVSFLWSETSGFPDIPRFLELDISSVRGKPLRYMETRVQNIPRWKISGYNFKHL